MITKILHNKIFIYLFSRYGIYAIQFATSLVIASKLGPYYFGIYGFILLILSYFGQLHLGIPNALNVLVIHNKEDKLKCNNYIANSLFLYVYFSIIIALLYLAYAVFGFKPIAKYQVDNYLPAMMLIAILVYINGVLTCVLRIKNQINQLSLVSSTNAILNICAVSMFSNETLIITLIICLIISNLITIFICYKYKVIPQYKNIHIKINIQKEILSKGLFLFLYNTCFYFIVITIRSIISSNYSIEEFGLFSFSFTIATAVITLLDSLLTIIFPKIIHLLSSDDKKKINNTLDILRISYVSTSHFLVYFAMIFYPLLLIIIPKYENSIISLNLISLSILMNANSCGYSTLLIAQNKEKYSATISITSLLINVLLGLFFVNIVKVSFSYVIIATMLTYMFFSFAIVGIGKKIIGSYSFKSTVSSFFPLNLFIPYLAALVISIYNLSYLFSIPLLLYLILNIKDLKRIKDYVVIIINNENISDINIKQ